MSYCPKITWATGLTPDEKRFWNSIQKGQTQSAITLREHLIASGFDPMNDRIMLKHIYDCCIISNNLQGIEILTEFKTTR